MDRNESANEGGSSPDTVIGRSSSEEDRNRHGCTTSGEYATVGGSSSSLDTLTGATAAPTGNDDKKRGRFGALKSSFRKEGGLFKIKKKTRSVDEAFVEQEPDVDEKETARKRSPEAEDDAKGGSSSTLKKKKKKSNSLVRKLSLNKFRLSTDQEPRQSREGGDSSRSQSQSSQESPSLSDSPSRIARKGQEAEAIPTKERLEHREINEAGEREGEKGETRKSEKLLEKPVSTVTVVQRRSPSLTIKSFSKTQHDSLSQEKAPRLEERCSSTLPYSISKWPEQKGGKQVVEATRKSKLNAKSESECGIRTNSSPREVRRKLSLLEEKRAIFQRRLFQTTKDSNSRETVVAVSLDDEDNNRTSAKEEEKREVQTKKKARHISVKKFDTFSTFEGTFDEETGVGYLAGIEEDYTESYDRQNHDYSAHPSTMGPMVGGSDNAERAKIASQDSTSSQNNAPNAGLGEKREHLYKILVIGELGAGKTSIIKRYVHQFFSQYYRATIGVDFALKVLNWDPHTIIRLQLWDIAGQERFGNMTRVYYKEAVGAFIVFDATRSATLNAVVKWKQDLDSKVQLPDGSPIPCVLLANKCDQEKEGLVNSPAKMDDYCKEKNFAGWFETSAKENINIEKATRFLVNKILQNDQLIKDIGSKDQTDGERFALNQSPASPKKSCFC
ncbi:RAS oncogene family member Rab32 isoform X1 [Colletes latitarsis]|uniref:RAS oncogene family member Rab32 isoform X1 n=1 Tax=Colletes latitarsis TaxID=2605962 RepID=UPI0040353CF4